MNYWKSSFKSIDGRTYSVKIEDSTLEADRVFMLGANAVVLNYEKGDHKYNPIRSASATVACATALDMSTIYSTSWDRKLTVTDEDTDKVVFDGYVIPAQWEQSATAGVNEFNIEAQDGLGYLANKKYELYNSTRRSALSFSQYVSKCAELIGCTVSWDIKDEYAKDIVFSEDVLLPDDYTEAKEENNWKTYAEGLSMIGLYLGAFFTVKNKVLCVCEYENTSEVWIEQAEAENVGAELTMSIEQAYSKIIGVPSAGSKVWVNKLLDNERMKKRTGYGWGKGTWSWTRAYTADRAHKISTAAPVDHKDLTSASNILAYATADGAQNWPDVSGELTPVTKGEFAVKDLAGHVNIYPDLRVTVEAEFFLQSQNITTAPYDWNTSIEENKQTSGKQPHIVAQVNGTTTNFIIDTSAYDSEGKGFYTVKYSFSLPVGNVTFKGVTGDNGTSYYFKSIKVESEAEMENDERVISTGFDNALSVELPLMYNSREAYLNYKGAVHNSHIFETVSAPIIDKLVDQYKVCRRRYTVALPYANFDIDKRVNIKGYNCTIDAAEVNLRYSRVSVNLLESY